MSSSSSTPFLSWSQCHHAEPFPASHSSITLNFFILSSFLNVCTCMCIFTCVHACHGTCSTVRGQPWVVSALLSSCLRQSLLYTTAQVRLARLWTGDSPVFSSHFPVGWGYRCYHICLSMGPEDLLWSSHLYDKCFIHWATSSTQHPIFFTHIFPFSSPPPMYVEGTELRRKER